MGDREGRAAAGRGIQRLLHHALRDGVERRRRLVEEQHGRVLQQHARDRDALLLAAGEAVAALADDRVVAVLEALDDVVDVRGAARVLELGVGRVGLGVAQVLADRGVEEIGLLRHDPDVVDDRLLREAADVLAGEEHLARRMPRTSAA